MNKGITNISYNSLNLPKKITYSDGSSVTYLYGADGKKYRTVHVIGGVTTTTEYIGNLLYINNTPQKMLTEVGYMDLTDNTYYYYLKDHQGNNRVVINSSGAVQEVNHYYPFGSTFATSNVQPYKYNGKELDTANGLNWYDYGARHYDAVLGRWHVMDPLGEKSFGVSPYAYCLSNPIKYIDPTGCEVIATDALSRRNILNTLTKEERKYVTFDEGGILNVALLNKSSSKSDNFSALRTLANSKIKYNFIVSERDVEGELFRSNSNSYYRGLTAFPNAENKPSKDNNVWIYTSAFENELVQAENTAHEAYGHAYFYDLNQSGNKNIDFHHRYINEVGESVWDEELQMNIPTLIRVDSNEKLKEQIDRVVNQTRLNYENK